MRRHRSLLSWQEMGALDNEVTKDLRLPQGGLKVAAPRFDSVLPKTHFRRENPVDTLARFESYFRRGLKGVRGGLCAHRRGWRHWFASQAPSPGQDRRRNSGTSGTHGIGGSTRRSESAADAPELCGPSFRSDGN